MEHIGYLTVPVEPEQFVQVQRILQAHGARLQKANRDPDDIWWIVFLPEGATREREETHVGVPKYTILLPDGYAFGFEAGTLNQYGLFTRNPIILIDVSEDTEINVVK